jgi:hypothetical protein
MENTKAQAQVKSIFLHSFSKTLNKESNFLAQVNFKDEIFPSYSSFSYLSISV